jgi:hypothetical protein
MYHQEAFSGCQPRETQLYGGKIDEDLPVKNKRNFLVHFSWCEILTIKTSCHVSIKKQFTQKERNAFNQKG